MALERAVARHRGEDRRVEGGRHLVGAVQPAVGLLAQQRQADAEHEAEEQAEDDRADRVAALRRRHDARLDDGRARRCRSRPAPWTRSASARSRSPSRPSRALGDRPASWALRLSRTCCARRIAWRSTASDAGVGPDRGQPRGALGRARRGRDADDVVLRRAGDGHVLLQVVDRGAVAAACGPWPGPRCGSRPPRCCPGPRLSASSDVGQQPGRVELGADRLAEEQLGRRLVDVALEEADRGRGAADEQHRHDDDERAAAQGGQERGALGLGGSRP